MPKFSLYPRAMTKCVRLCQELFYRLHMTVSHVFGNVFRRSEVTSNSNRQTDGRTDRHRPSFHNAPPYGGRGIINCNQPPVNDRDTVCMLDVLRGDSIKAWYLIPHRHRGRPGCSLSLSAMPLSTNRRWTALNTYGSTDRQRDGSDTA